MAKLFCAVTRYDIAQAMGELTHWQGMAVAKTRLFNEVSMQKNKTKCIGYFVTSPYSEYFPKKRNFLELVQEFMIEFFISYF